MQLPKILLPLFASGTLATVLSTFAATEWTIQSLTRTCNTADTSCTWTFGINTDANTTTPCTFVVNSTAPDLASQAKAGGPGACDIYTITSGWSDQFGAGQGFTVLSVVDYATGLIAYPGYTDNMLKNGSAVEPDLSFPVQTLP